MSVRDALPVFVLGLLISTLTLNSANAATASASFGVSATVQATCRASAMRTSWIFTGGQTNTKSPVSVTCSNGAGYNVNLNAGMGLGANLVLREMAGAGTALLGNVLKSRRADIVSRDQRVSMDTGDSVGNRIDQTLPDHQRIAAGQRVPIGAYMDTIIVTVTY